MSREEGQITVSGAVQRIVYRNEDTGYTVFQLKTPQETVTCTGYVHFSEGEGEIFEVTGEWEEHPRYGRQLRVVAWSKPTPADREVAVHLFRRLQGVGSRLAGRIVSALGPEAVDIVIDCGEEALAGIPGLSADKIRSIVTQVREHHGTQKILAKLMALGLSPGTAMRVQRAFGDRCLQEIETNPYRLMDVEAVGFQQADAVARRLGLPRESPFRLQGALRHVLSTACAEGHCWMDRERWIGETGALLAAADGEPLEPALLEREAGVLEEQQRIKRDEGDLVYLREVWEAEERVARWVAERLRVSFLQPSRFDDLIDLYEREHGVTLSPRQRQAVKTAMASPLLILTGGPGTGKTTTIRAILWCYRRLFPRASIGMGAPTGRAARRLEEVSGFPAGTLHRLLGISRDGVPEFDEDRLLPFELVVVDEASMMDLFLTDKLLRAVGPSKLLLVGDVDQLPSVGPGHVLNDLIRAGVPCIRLDMIFRQAQQSHIVLNAHRVLRGEMPERGGDFCFVEIPGTGAQANAAIGERLEEAVQQLLAEGYRPEEIQVLSPTKKSELGTEALNVRLQRLMNPPAPGKKEIRAGGKSERIWRTGDKVIQMRNDYDKEVFNGEIGKIEDLDEEDGVLWVRFGDAVHEYGREDWDQLRHAYAITVHKSQGGEYPVVLIPLTTSHYILLYRNLLYTGITRAKELCVLIGTSQALCVAVRNTQPVVRRTRLAERIAARAGSRDRIAGDP